MCSPSLRWRVLGASLLSLCWVAPTTLADTVRVAVAANFRPVLDSLAADFEAQSDHQVQVVSGSTGKLYAQIVAGAPFDLLLAADQVRPQRLVDDGLAAATTRQTYAVGRLALWDPSGAEVNEARLRAGDYRRLAIAHPELAPYGAAAQSVLRALDLELKRSNRLAYAENVAQAFAFVRTGNADLGFVALSQLLTIAPAKRGRYWVLPADRHPPIRQDMVLLRRARGQRVGARELHEYILSPNAQSRIRAAGYDAPSRWR